MNNLNSAITAILLTATVALTCLLVLVYAPVASAAPVTCATVNNVTNAAAWRTPSGQVFRATYADNGTLQFSRPVPRSVTVAVAKLDNGTPGPKIARACA